MGVDLRPSATATTAVFLLAERSAVLSVLAAAVARPASALRASASASTCGTGAGGAFLGLAHRHSVYVRFHL